MKRTLMNKALFIRRDNIGDLVCTTPAIRALRLRYPEMKIGVLVNSYNAGAIRNNPDVDAVYVYEKEKHSSRGALGVFLNNLGAIRSIRAEGYGAAIGCSYTYSERAARYAYLTGAGLRIGYVPGDKRASRFFYNSPLPEPAEPLHEVEAMMGLVGPLGVTGPPPSLVVRPDEAEAKKALGYLMKAGLKDASAPVIFHISSRRPQNRWPREKFKELAERIEAAGHDIILLWSPGSSSNPLHPGDDESAEWMLSNMHKRPLAFRTETLTELIAVMSLGGTAVCSDGGAMHIAAGLGKPVLTIWGSTDRRRWAPWGVEHIILQKDTKLAESITVDEAFAAFKKLSGC